VSSLPSTAYDRKPTLVSENLENIIGVRIQCSPGVPTRKLAAELVEDFGITLNRALLLIDQWRG
jgi:hypothetical protein